MVEPLDERRLGDPGMQEGPTSEQKHRARIAPHLGL
jgi:hypothetical protein